MKTTEESMKEIRWGIAGPGIIANKFAAAAKKVEGASLAAVASRSLERASAFAGKYDIPLAFGSYEDMARSDEVDAVYVSTAHPFHFECVKTFLLSGKPVLCEKPLCINERDAKELAALARERGVFLMEAMWTKFLPAVREAKKIAESGGIGNVTGLEADFCYRSSPEEEAKLFDNSLAGGSLLDVGVYGLHLASLFFGNEPEKIVALSDVKGGVDLHTAVTLSYKGGAIANISSAIALQKPETAYIYGTKGRIRIPTFYGATELFVDVGEGEKHIKKPPAGDGFEEEIYEACACIRDGRTESLIHPLSDTIAVIAQTDRIRKMIGVSYPFDR